MTEVLHLTSLNEDELVSLAKEMNQPAFRGKQIFRSLHKRRLRSFEEMTDLPKEFRASLEMRATASTLKVESRYISDDGTRRFLMKTHDNLPVETVFIPTDHRDTICFSSQSGCPLQCDFCLTAKLGLLRSLTAGEMIEQIIIALNDAYGIGNKTPRGTNLVAMGAGEPFLNYDELMKAVRVMAVEDGLHIVPNRITVSTVGIVPKILDFANEKQRPHLAISLSAPTDKLRNVLMPVNKKWNLKTLMEACKEFQTSLRPGEKFTFEYVMLAGVNDSDEQARQLANLLNRHGLQRVKINLIPHNAADPLPYHPSPMERIESFQSILESKGINTFLRRPRGRDIYAACGQLAARQTTNPMVKIDSLIH